MAKNNHQLRKKRENCSFLGFTDVETIYSSKIYMTLEQYLKFIKLSWLHFK